VCAISMRKIKPDGLPVKSMDFEVDSLSMILVSVNHDGEIGDVGAVAFTCVSPRIIEYSNMNRAFQGSLFG